MKLTSVLPLSLISVTAMAPGTHPAPRQQPTTLCSQFSYWSGSGYEANNNLWGQDSATSGSQCTSVDGSSAAGVQWRTEWTWRGGPGQVKSFAYAGKQLARGQTLARVVSIPTAVAWQYNTTAGVRANAAYDIFTAADAGHENSSGDYEVMIWLARLGDIRPIGSSTGTVSVGGWPWDLWVGMNGDMPVYSFVAPGTTNSFSGDAKLFFDYLQTYQGFPASSQNLIVFQFGTETFTGGPASMSVAQFSASIN
ncbi:glycoside hydrolase family 12 protein [Lasiosphaeria miniovina]|uniref:Glycoside hydrolase family 12 protein n=1 Tax=Lasiosphaeria miniovina TaxID=1954250 RepID=A0AA40AWU5_9PEZI|nr:glycoside hydrolase family 12 protein [Lasiosphaeria miniovina]KAK0723458.1 glycoside hydrolase family 12 protein [Lasiosphaeria miniovina]